MSNKKIFEKAKSILEQRVGICYDDLLQEVIDCAPSEERGEGFLGGVVATYLCVYETSVELPTAVKPLIKKW